MKLFNKIRRANPQKSRFDLSHTQLHSGNFGELIPILLIECLPGDEIDIQSQLFLRAMPMIAPPMTRTNAYMHSFFVPNRLVFPDFDKFIAGDETIVHPTFNISELDMEQGSIADHLGLVIHGTGNFINHAHDQIVTPLPFYAYGLIYNEYYRNEYITTEYTLDMTNADFLSAMTENVSIPKRCWEKDYYTSAKPFVMVGTAPQVPVNINNIATAIDGGGSPVGSGDVTTDANSYLKSDADFINIETNSTVDPLDIRYAEKLTRFLEKLAQTGMKYYEYLYGIWGTEPEDMRLQRPEYIGGGAAPFVISEVLSTTETVNSDDELINAVGTMAGHGASLGNTYDAKYTAKEHGYILTILSVIPEHGLVTQGVRRLWSKETWLDYPIPDFANLSMQEIKNKEIYWQANKTEDDMETTWGYQERYSEYKFMHSTCTALFNKELPQWHLMRYWQTPVTVPPLDNLFINCDPPDTIWAYTDNYSKQLIIQVRHNISALRSLPEIATPSII